MPNVVTDPEVIRRVREAAGRGGAAQPAPTAAAPAGRPVSDPGVIQRVKNRARFNAAAKQKREQILAIGENMPEAPDRIEQAFDVASDPIADQSLRPEYDPYTFREDVSRSIPFASEAAAGVAAAGPYLSGKFGYAPETGFGEAYNRQKILGRAEEERYARQHPGAHLGATALGVAATGPTGAARAFGIRAAPAAAAIPATVGGRVAEGIRGGAPLGALYGAGEGEGLKERAVNAAKGAGIGAGVGAALPLAGAAVRSARRLSTGYEPQLGGHAPRLEQAADHFYGEMDRAGVQLRPAAFNRILTNIQVRARNAGIDNELHPAATAIGRALQRDIHDLTRAPTLRRMDQIRRKIRDAVPKNASDDERRIIRTMVEGLDENLNRLTPRDLTGGAPGAGMTALREGRRLQRQMYKAETVDNLVENAKDKLGKNYTQAGLQTAIKQEFGSLSKKIRMDPRERGRWTNEERVLIQRIVRGGPGEKVGRWIGKLALRGPIGVGAYGSGSTTAMVAGLDPLTTGVLATSGAAVGEAAKRISTARNVMNTERLGNLIEHGHTNLPRPAIRPRGVQARRLTTMLGLGLGDRLLTGER